MMRRQKRMFWAECRKVFSWKPLFIILALLLSVNAFLLFHQEQNTEVSYSYYRVLWNELSDKTDSEKLDYLNQELKNESYYHKDGTVDYDRYILMDRFREQLESILSYDSYIESIQTKASTFSSGMFHIDEDTFTYRKNMHLPEIYKNVENITPVFDISEGILKLTGNYNADIFCGIFLFIISILMIIRDREQNTIFLLRSTKNGRQMLLLNRISLMFIISVISTIIFLAEDMLICRYFYRFGDLFRPVQSLDGFIGCALPVSVLGYMSIYFIVKCVFMFLLGIFFIFVCQIAKSNFQIYITTSIGFVIEFLLYKKTSGVLSKLNIFCLSNVNQMTKTYQDINLFGYPFSLFSTSIITMLAVTAIFVFVTIYLDKKHRLMYHNYSFTFKMNRKKRLLSPIGYSFYHSLVGQKAIFLCAALVILSAFQFISFQKPYDINDTYYHAYVNQTEGITTNEASDFFDEENTRFEAIEKQYDELSASENNTAQLRTLEKQLEPKQALQELENHVQKAKNSINDETRIFYDSGYIRLFSFLSDEQVRLILISLLFLVFTVSPLISSDFENGTIQIIRSTIYGQKKYYRDKVIVTLMYAISADILLWIPYVISIKEKYSLPHFNSLIQNIRGLEAFPVQISILTFILIYFVIIFVRISFASIIMLLISRCTKSRMSAIILNALIFVLVPVLKLIHVF